MRKVDESRVANYIRKHSNYKKWLAFVLCLSLLTGTITLYILNKPATAMTAEGAEGLGVMLETASDGDEQVLIQQTLENKVESDEGGNGDDLFSEFNEDGNGNEGGDGNNDNDGNDNGDGNSDVDEPNKTGDVEETNKDLVEKEVTEEEAKEGEEQKAENEETEETEVKAEELTQDVVLTVSYVDENGESIADEKELSVEENFDPANEAPSIEGYTFKEATFDGEAISKITVLKNDSDIKYYEVTFDNDETKEIKKDGSVVLTYTAEEEDLVLTASYVDEDGKEIAEEEELEISESFDPKKDSDTIEGYTFKEAKIDEDVVVLITSKEDEESGEKFYEATLEDESVVEIKEDTTIILTYTAVDTTVVLTAKFVERNGEEFQESKDLNIGDETELKKSKITEVDGYFFYKAIYEEKEITKIAPIFEEEKKDTDKDDVETETESEPEESDEESAAVKTTGYKFTTVDGEEIEITEDAEIELTYLKASTETEFTFEDSKVSVKATVNGKNVFPEGIELKANEVTSSSAGYNYDAYMNALNENSDAIANDAGQENVTEFTENNTLLYDIAFMFEEKELQPAEGSVNISVEFKNNQLSEELEAANEESVTVVHLPIKAEVKEQSDISCTAEATDISANDIEVKTLTDAATELGNVEKVEFVEDNFSTFAFITGDTLRNTWDGTRDITLADFSPISSLFYYSVVSNELESYGHIEGNVRTGIYAIPNDSPNFNNARYGNQVQKNAITEIDVVKTVVNGVNGTFKFGFFDEQDNLIADSEFEITTEGDTKTKSKPITAKEYPSVFESLNAGKVLHVYELEYDENGNILRYVKEGEKNNDYIVSYKYSDILGFDSGEIAYDHSNNYIGEFKSLAQDAIGVDHNFFRADHNYIGEHWVNGKDIGKTNGYLYFGYDQDVYVQNGANFESEFTYVEGLTDTISRELDTAKDVSVLLATGKNYASGDNNTGNLVNVLNIKSTTGTLSGDLAAVNLKAPFIEGLISSDQYLLINIAVGSDTYNIDEQNPSFDGQNPEGDGYSPLASHIIYNFVNADRTEPYSGIVNITSWSDGLLLAPAATVDQTPAFFTGEIIGNYVKHGNGNEIHKKPIISGKAVTVNITNTGDAPCSLIVKKEWESEGVSLNKTITDTFSPVTVRVWQTYEGGTAVPYPDVESSKVVLSKDIAWQETFQNVPRFTENGKEYKYFIQELNSSNQGIEAGTAGVRYYNSKTVAGVATTSDKTTNFSEVAIAAGNDAQTLVLVCINTRSLNVLPSTGGMGDLPYMATGLGTAVAGLLGAGAYSKKKKKDDEE